MTQADETEDEGSTTSTTEVQRVVGEPLDSWVTLSASAALLVAILVLGLITRARMNRRR